MLCCHGDDEGMLIHLAENSNMHAVDSNLYLLTVLARAAAQAKTIEKLPKEKKAESWKRLLESLKGFDKKKMVKGDLAAKPVSKYEETFQSLLFQAALSLGLHTTATLTDYLDKITAMQALNMTRVEIRGCSVGKKDKTMTNLRRFFNCKTVVAPDTAAFAAEFSVKTKAKFDPSEKAFTKNVRSHTRRKKRNERRNRTKSTRTKAINCQRHAASM
jgi:hypothetical protein